MFHAEIGCEARDHARAMFQRVLAAWAVDALSLRRRGLDRPCSRDGAGFAPGRSDAGRLGDRGLGDAPARRGRTG